MRSIVVIPCFNEARRLSPVAFDEFRADPDVQLLFVDDGSTDGTRAALEAIRERSGGRVVVLGLARNSGKAEAVRAGLLAAFEAGAEQLAYLDADLATPPAEMIRLLGIQREREVAVVLGARVGLLGTTIERRAVRHYMGRVFATFASIVLDLRVYDTQCGAKVFCRSELLRRTLERPFSSRWAFDVELIGRLMRGVGDLPGLSSRDFLEVPLQVWRDIGKSKLGFWDVPRMGLDLLKIAVRLRSYPGR
jgi:glycosyltransferase involved in cell wall biosynthesis